MKPLKSTVALAALLVAAFGMAMASLRQARAGELEEPPAEKGDEKTAEKPTEKAPEPHFRIEMRKGLPYVGIRRKGDASVGDYYEVRRGASLLGYVEVAEMDGPWPKLAFLIGFGHKNDELVPVPLPMPEVQLLTDEPNGADAKELKALCGDKLTIVPIGDLMRVPRPEEALVVFIHGGAPFMMGDPMVRAHAEAGGVVVIDTLAHSHLKGNIVDEKLFDKKPPAMRIIHVGKLTAGLAQEDRIPWFGTREAKDPKDKRDTKGKKFIARYMPGQPDREAALLIATDDGAQNTAMMTEHDGRMLVLDLISPNGRAGRDPGSKNKWVFVARALGTGPRLARYYPNKPSTEDLAGRYDYLIKENEGRVTKTMEGGGANKEDFVYSITLGQKGKPLVVLVGAIEGTWPSSAALVRLAEVLLDNPGNDCKIEWLLQRLQIKLLPCLNLHGYRTDKPLNDRKCDVNRNFPYCWEDYADKAHRGKEPFSEAESSILKRIVEEEKPIALLSVEADDYEAGYRIIRARDLTDAQQGLLRACLTILNARLRHRFVIGDEPLAMRLTRDAQRPSATNWAGSKGMLAASLRICGDGEDSLINNDVAIEGCLTFLTTVALSLEKPLPPEPAPAETPVKPPPRKGKE